MRQEGGRGLVTRWGCQGLLILNPLCTCALTFSINSQPPLRAVTEVWTQVRPVAFFRQSLWCRVLAWTEDARTGGVRARGLGHFRQASGQPQTRVESRVWCRHGDEGHPAARVSPGAQRAAGRPGAHWHVRWTDAFPAGRGLVQRTPAASFPLRGKPGGRAGMSSSGLLRSQHRARGPAGGVRVLS